MSQTPTPKTDEPCPLCGSPADNDNDAVAPRVRCCRPRCSMHNYAMPPEEWNQRKPMVRLERDNARLKADCERLRAALHRIASESQGLRLRYHTKDETTPPFIEDIARAALRDAQAKEQP